MREIKVRSNLCAGIVIILFSIGILVIMPSQIQSVTAQESGFEADYFPRLLTYVMMLCGIGLVVQSLVLKKDVVFILKLSEELQVALYMCLMILYVLLIPVLGFLVSSIAFGAISLVYMCQKSLWLYAAIIILTIVLWASFTFALGVALP